MAPVASFMSCYYLVKEWSVTDSIIKYPTDGCPTRRDDVLELIVSNVVET